MHGCLLCYGFRISVLNCAVVESTGKEARAFAVCDEVK